jgi:hypothetical protein
MDYIPVSRIENLIIPNEGHQIDVDSFWIDLGYETCNLRKMSWYCFDILQQSFGKTEYKHWLTIKWSALISELDNLVLMNYPRSILQIKDIPIIQIFYDCKDLIEYPILIKGDQPYRKNITQQDRIYIELFLQRLDVYLKYIDNNILNIFIYNNKNLHSKSYKTNIKNIVQKFQKKRERMVQDINQIN